MTRDQYSDELYSKEYEGKVWCEHANKIINRIFDDFETQLKAKDQTISSLMDAQDNWINERADLQAIIERQGERIRCLEKQYRDLNPKGIQ